jgi:hypothetical protein
MRLLPGSSRLARIAADPSVRAGIGGTPDDRTQRRGFLLVLFMRCLACVWVGQALVQWTDVLTARDSLLDQAPVQWRVAIIFFAVLDPVAAVGLWLATPWGGVIWLFAALSQIVAAVTIPGFFSPLWIGVDGLLVGLYFLLTWLSWRSPEIR